MELQDLLIFVLFIFAWGISLLSKKLKGKPRVGEPKGFTLKILEFIAELKQASEREINGPLAVDTQPDTTANTSDTETANLSVQVEDEHSLVADLVDDIYVGGALSPDENTVVDPVINLSTTVPTKMLSSNRGFTHKFCRKKMREAVIWSEILGPPVALQKK